MSHIHWGNRLMILTVSLTRPQPKVLWLDATTFPKNYLLDLELISQSAGHWESHSSLMPVASGKALLQDFWGLSDAKTELAPYPPSEVLRDLPDSKALFFLGVTG